MRRKTSNTSNTLKSLKILCFDSEGSPCIEVDLKKDREIVFFISGPNIKKRTLSISNIDLIYQWIEENKKNIYRLAFEKMKGIAESINKDRVCFVMEELKTDSFKTCFISKNCKEPFRFIYKERNWEIDKYKRGRAEIF